MIADEIEHTFARLLTICISFCVSYLSHFRRGKWPFTILITFHDTEDGQYFHIMDRIMVAVLTLSEIPFWDHIKGSESQGDYINMSYNSSDIPQRFIPQYNYYKVLWNQNWLGVKGSFIHTMSCRHLNNSKNHCNYNKSRGLSRIAT